MSIKQAVFCLDGEEYGLNITEVNTIEKDMDIKKIADLPDNVKGIINLRGNEIPVYSLRRKFGLEDKEPDKSTRYLVTKVDEMYISFEVDHVKGILDIEASDIFDTPQIIKTSNTSYIKSIARAGDGLILLLDSKELVDSNEMKTLEKKLKK